MISAEELRLCAANSTGSGRGMSFWTMAAACGKKALLSEERDAERARTMEEIPYDPLKPAAFVVGAAYHKLHELWRQWKLQDWSIARVLSETEDASIILAAQLFDGYKRNWTMCHWGTTVAVEEVLTARVGNVLVNAKPDLVVEVTASQLDRVGARCPEITQPGRYIVDFKTESRAYDDMYYRGGLQALWYPLAWNQCYPDRPVDGIVFDIIRKPNPRTKEPAPITSDSFRALYSPCHMNEVTQLAGLIAQGEANLERAKKAGRGNRAECVRFGFGGADVCSFYAGMCDGA